LRSACGSIRAFGREESVFVSGYPAFTPRLTLFACGSMPGYYRPSLTGLEPGVAEVRGSGTVRLFFARQTPDGLG